MKRRGGSTLSQRLKDTVASQASHLELAVPLPGQVPHAGGLQVDQPAGDLLLPLLLQVAQHAALQEHLPGTTGGGVTQSPPPDGRSRVRGRGSGGRRSALSHPAGAHDDAPAVHIQLRQQLLHRLVRRREEKANQWVGWEWRVGEGPRSLSLTFLSSWLTNMEA